MKRSSLSLTQREGSKTNVKTGKDGRQQALRQSDLTLHQTEEYGRYAHECRSRHKHEVSFGLIMMRPISLLE